MEAEWRMTVHWVAFWNVGVGAGRRIVITQGGWRGGARLSDTLDDVAEAVLRAVFAMAGCG